MPLETDEQNLAIGPSVHLFQLDATSLGGTIEHFTNTTDLEGPNNGLVSFGGQVYTPIDIQVDGFEVSGRGQLPTPVVRFANTQRTLTAATTQYKDFVGAKITRIRTLAKYLDGWPDADPTAFWPPDVYRVAQKSGQNRLFIEFKLEAWTDLEGESLPGRKITRNYCRRVYRMFDPETQNLVYSKGDFVADCPYVGDTYYTILGAVTGDMSKDVCGKQYSDCKKRFGTEPIPGYHFPGAGRMR
jgi:lambda family phage minor tail protein L